MATNEIWGLSWQFLICDQYYFTLKGTFFYFLFLTPLRNHLPKREQQYIFGMSGVLFELWCPVRNLRVQLLCISWKDLRLYSIFQISLDLFIFFTHTLIFFMNIFSQSFMLKSQDLMTMSKFLILFWWNMK